MSQILITLLMLGLLGHSSAGQAASLGSSFLKQQFQHDIKTQCLSLCAQVQQNWDGYIVSSLQGRVHIIQANYEYDADYQCACSIHQQEFHDVGFHSHIDAYEHCPGICEQATFQATQVKGMIWTGDWWNINNDAISVCLCQRPTPKGEYISFDEPEDGGDACDEL